MKWEQCFHMPVALDNHGSAGMKHKHELHPPAVDAKMSQQHFFPKINSIMQTVFLYSHTHNNGTFTAHFKSSLLIRKY